MEIRDALNDAVCSTLANMAFVDAEPTDPDPGNPNPGQIVAIEFLRPLKGSLALHLSAATKRLVTENIHGMDWGSLTGSEVDDCLMELVNIVAGTFLANVGAGEHRTALSLPEVLYDEDALGFRGHESQFYFNVNDDTMLVSVEFGMDTEDKQE